MTEINDQSNEVRQSKASWLSALEQQSWQAELLISSIAILGSMQLPGLINQLVDYMLIKLPQEFMGWLPYFIVFYLLIASVGMVVLFIVHLVLRSFWIGMVGLVSTYPGGINLESDIFNDFLRKKVKLHLPDIDQYNAGLDDKCSTLFASAFLLVLMMMGIAILMFSVLIISYLLSLILPFSTQAIGIAIGGVYGILFFMYSILNIESLKQNPRLYGMYYLFTCLVVLSMYSFFWRATTYIMYTFRSHARGKLDASAQGGVAVLVMLFTLPLLFGSNIFMFLEDRYPFWRAGSDTIYSDAYNDQREDDQYAFFPSIDSFEISSKDLKVFLPIIEREQSAMDELVPKPKQNSDLSRHEKRQVRTAHNLKQSAAFHSFFINDSKVEEISYFYQSAVANKQEGVVALINGKHLSLGENRLKIEKANLVKEGVAMEIYINFVYNPS